MRDQAAKRTKKALPKILDRLGFVQALAVGPPNLQLTVDHQTVDLQCMAPSLEGLCHGPEDSGARLKSCESCTMRSNLSQVVEQYLRFRFTREFGVPGKIAQNTVANSLLRNPAELFLH